MTLLTRTFPRPSSKSQESELRAASNPVFIEPVRIKHIRVWIVDRIPVYREHWHNDLQQSRVTAGLLLLPVDLFLTIICYYIRSNHSFPNWGFFMRLSRKSCQAIKTNKYETNLLNIFQIFYSCEQNHFKKYSSSAIKKFAYATKCSCNLLLVNTKSIVTLENLFYLLLSELRILNYLTNTYICSHFD